MAFTTDGSGTGPPTRSPVFARPTDPADRGRHWDGPSLLRRRVLDRGLDGLLLLALLVDAATSLQRSIAGSRIRTTAAAACGHSKKGNHRQDKQGTHHKSCFPVEGRIAIADCVPCRGAGHARFGGDQPPRSAFAVSGTVPSFAPPSPWRTSQLESVVAP